MAIVNLRPMTSRFQYLSKRFRSLIRTCHIDCFVLSFHETTYCILEVFAPEQGMDSCDPRGTDAFKAQSVGMDDADGMDGQIVGTDVASHDLGVNGYNEGVVGKCSDQIHIMNDLESNKDSDV